MQSENLWHMLKQTLYTFVEYMDLVNMCKYVTLVDFSLSLRDCCCQSNCNFLHWRVHIKWYYNETKSMIEIGWSISTHVFLHSITVSSRNLYQLIHFSHYLGMAINVSIFLNYVLCFKHHYQVLYLHISHCTANANNCNWCVMFNKILKYIE